MEFPDLGKNCSFCQRLDFLPFVCMHCRIVFCKEHLHTSSHSCPEFEENIRTIEQDAKVGEPVVKVRCAFCKERIGQELEIVSCDKCNLKYCLSHRIPEVHQCPKLKEERLQMLSKFRKDEPVVQAKAVQVPKVRGSKNDALSRKVALMQLKQKARGPPVPDEERVHVFVLIEATGKKEPFYFSMTWTLGRCVDFVTTELKVENRNNRTNGSRVFLATRGSDVGLDYSLTISEAVQESVIVSGDTLVLKTTSGSNV